MVTSPVQSRLDLAPHHLERPRPGLSSVPRDGTQIFLADSKTGLHKTRGQAVNLALLG